MAQVFNSNTNNLCLQKGDPVELTIRTNGAIKAEIGDTAKFMVKASVSDPDGSALLTKDISVTSENEISIYIPTSETQNLTSGKYYWSVKHYKGGDSYTIIPDSRRCSYPTFTVEEDLIDVY